MSFPIGSRGCANATTATTDDSSASDAAPAKPVSAVVARSAAPLAVALAGVPLAARQASSGVALATGAAVSSPRSSAGLGGVSDDQKSDRKADGGHGAHAALFKKFGIPSCAATRCLLPQAKLDWPLDLDGGLNDIYLFPADDGEGGAKPAEQLFKPLLPAGRWAQIGQISELGVNPEHARIGERNLASRLLNVALADKSDEVPLVIVPTALATAELRNGSACVGVLMEKVPGAEITTLRPAQLQAPALRAQLTWLQLLDGLAGQIDRHPGNFLIAMDDDDGTHCRVSGIDNDQSWGNNTRVEQVINKSMNFNGCGWPRVIDTSMRAACLAFKDSDLQSLLEPLLPEALAPAKARLATLHAYLASDKVTVIAPQQWGGDHAAKGFSDPDSSYLGRELGRRATRFGVATGAAGLRDNKGAPQSLASDATAAHPALPSDQGASSSHARPVAGAGAGALE